MLRIFSIKLMILFVLSVNLMAQSGVNIKKGDFREKKDGFNEAWNHVLSGDAFYLRKGSYYKYAYDHYIQALAYNSRNAELNYKTGISAIYSDNKEKAAGFFLKALDLKSDVADDILLYTGRALQYAGSYEDATEKLTGYLKSNVKKSGGNLILARRFIEECNSALILTRDPIGLEVTNAGANINSGSDDFSPVLTYDGATIYFASRRKDEKKSGSSVETRTDEDIYISRKSDGNWSIATLTGGDLNTEYNEAPLYIDSAGTRLYIYSGFENGGDIKVSVSRKGEWKAPENLPFGINSIESETSVAFHPSGSEVYFVTSDGKDNMGGYDICFITRLSDKKWSKPQNAGTGINTSYDEQSVSFSRSGDTIWFSSKGHNSIGGFDIFYSVRNKDGSWGKAINGGYPLNTQWDEMFHSTSPTSGDLFYFVSNRSGGFGGLDIYSGRLLSKPALTDTSVEAENPRSESPQENSNAQENVQYFFRED